MLNLLKMNNIMSLKFFITVFAGLIIVSSLPAHNELDSLKMSLKYTARHAVNTNSHEKLNEILEIAYSRYGSDSQEYRRAVLWCAGYCAEAGDTKQALKLYRRVKGGLNSTREQIASLQTLVMIHRNGNENLAISCMKTLEKVQSQYYGSYSDERLNTLLDIAELYALHGRLEKSDIYLSKASEALKARLDDKFSRSTQAGRNSYWYRVSKFFDRFMDVAFHESGRLLNSRSINRNAYNSILLSKGILMSTEREYDSYLVSLHDSVADSLFAIKKNMILHNEPLDKVDSADQVLVDYLIGKGYLYHNPNFELSWTDIQKVIGDDDIVIEYFRTSRNLYGALYFKKDWNAPRCIGISDVLEYGNEKSTLTSVLPFEPRPYDDGFNSVMSASMAKIIWPEKLLKCFPKTKEGKVYFSTVAELDITPIEYLGDMHEKFNMCRLSSTRQLLNRKTDVDNGFSCAGFYGGVDFRLSVDQQRASLDSLKSLPASVSRTNIQMRDFSYENLFSSILSGKNVNRAAVDALPSSIAEVVNISEMCRECDCKTHIFTGGYASEDAFKQFSCTEDIIHFATHGFYFTSSEAQKRLNLDNISNYDDPMLRSGINLAGVSGEDYLGVAADDGMSDGYLIALEIAQTNLSGTKLVVLSACNSGKGDIERDGVFGIQRAFKIAGADAIIMSLWQVNDDVAKDMMVMFYKNLLNQSADKEHMDIRKAFYTALRDIRNKYPGDYLWSPFIIMDAI